MICQTIYGPKSILSSIVNQQMRFLRHYWINKLALQGHEEQRINVGKRPSIHKLCNRRLAPGGMAYAKTYLCRVSRMVRSFKLLGGESFPSVIDDAIKHRTYRLLALLSHHSISKPNPQKERTLALSIGRERETDFLIPINVDGLKATELDWMTTDLTYIPFNVSWADGLDQLLKKLESIETPRPLTETGREAAIDAYLPKSALTKLPEYLYFNCLPIERIPSIIKRFEFSRQLSWEELQNAGIKWAFRTDARERRRALSFQTPLPDMIPDVTIKSSGAISWNDVKTIDGIDSHNLMVALLNKCLKKKILEKGLLLTEKKQLYFPRGLLEGDWLKFAGYDGKSKRLQVAGERSLWVGRDKRINYYYHLSPDLWIRRDLSDTFMVQVNVRLHITDSLGRALKHRSAASRRKKVSQGWKNRQWLMRHIGICRFLSDSSGKIIIGQIPDEQVIVSGSMVKLGSPYGIDEASLRKITGEPAEINESDITGDDITVDGINENE
jgi:hypothetical protein